MKKFLLYLLIITGLASLILCGCGKYFYTTWEYREQHKLYTGYEKGKSYTKETVFGKLGYPEYYGDEDGNGEYINILTKETYRDVIFATETTKWSYTCYELPDPANPCRLEIEFDGKGNVVNMDFYYIPGG